MRANPVLRRLGFDERDRVVVIHADDLGMCQATIQGLEELYEAGLVSSGSVMVPCPWFLGAARFAAAHPQADLGVHITLTSEWETYRWRPLSTMESSSGLLDAQGYLPATSEAVQEAARPEAADREIQAQIQLALRQGLDLTHVDTHMGAVAHERFMESYLTRALEAGLPPMALRLDEEGWRAMGLGLGEEAIRRIVQASRDLEDRGVPLEDRIRSLPLEGDPSRRLDQAKRELDALPPGLTHFIIHPAADTPELRAIAPDAAFRIADHAVFSGPELRSHVRKAGIQIIGYRALRDLIR